ncbi:hypothetical protein IRJ41_001315 [Triplophysa rosa]|uniref:Ig-like domain-containing protein n=1 Tax=Triplophysa rosa TaxID=992332 RepID=A0A9W7T529_TRIRA|nr:hypothetical protein IRJ41_001315 [Triplophysa rosa]
MAENMFHTLLFCLCTWRLIGVFCVIDEVKSAKEGDSVTLHTKLTELHCKEVIMWTFGPQKSLIAHRVTGTVPVFSDVLNGRFRARLQVDDQTGSLTITNITTQHSGLYEMITSIATGNLHRFDVIVYTRLPVPVIIRDSSQCSSSSERSSVSTCVLLCSVMNVSHVSLSWYKGKSLLSSISVSDLNIRLSLPLEVEHQDTNTYRCVLSHPFRNQTQHLNINDVCHTCSDCVFCCNGTGAVIRLVVSVLVGIATVVVLIYEIRSR